MKMKYAIILLLISISFSLNSLNRGGDDDIWFLVKYDLTKSNYQYMHALSNAPKYNEIMMYIQVDKKALTVSIYPFLRKEEAEVMGFDVEEFGYGGTTIKTYKAKFSFAQMNPYLTAYFKQINNENNKESFFYRLEKPVRKTPKAVEKKETAAEDIKPIANEKEKTTEEKTKPIVDEINELTREEDKKPIANENSEITVEGETKPIALMKNQTKQIADKKKGNRKEKPQTVDKQIITIKGEKNQKAVEKQEITTKISTKTQPIFSEKEEGLSKQFWAQYEERYGYSIIKKLHNFEDEKLKAEIAGSISKVRNEKINSLVTKFKGRFEINTFNSLIPLLYMTNRPSLYVHINTFVNHVNSQSNNVQKKVQSSLNWNHLNREFQFNKYLIDFINLQKRLGYEESKPKAIDNVINAFIYDLLQIVEDEFKKAELKYIGLADLFIEYIENKYLKTTKKLSPRQKSILAFAKNVMLKKARHLTKLCRRYRAISVNCPEKETFYHEIERLLAKGTKLSVENDKIEMSSFAEFERIYDNQLFNGEDYFVTNFMKNFPEKLSDIKGKIEYGKSKTEERAKDIFNFSQQYETPASHMFEIKEDCDYDLI
jgi:hypothetical protein